MNWYIVKFVFRIVCGEGKHQPQFDEQLRLINATDEQQAHEKALKLARFEQDSLDGSNQKAVKWEFIAITELTQIESLNDGAEIYYAVRDVEDADRYIATAQQKSRLIQTGLTNAI